jgi:oxygen-dependent protoporphyrinogen oxidase
MPLATSSHLDTRKIRMGLEVFIPRKKDKDETLGSFVRRRLGQEVLDKIAEPLVAGVHAGDPETMSVRASFPKFVQLEGSTARLSRDAQEDGAYEKPTGPRGFA